MGSPRSSTHDTVAPWLELEDDARVMSAAQLDAGGP